MTKSDYISKTKNRTKKKLTITKTLIRTMRIFYFFEEKKLVLLGTCFFFCATKNCTQKNHLCKK